MRKTVSNRTMLFALAAMALAAGALMAKPQERDWSQMFLALNPSVSPDGKLFVFEWKDRVWLAPTAGGTAVPVGDGMSADTRPFLSPDGKRIAFLSDRWGTLQLFEMDLDAAAYTAGNLRQITFHTESLFPWGYTPDGSEMLALAYRDDASETSSSKRLSRRPILVSMRERKAEKLLFDAPAFCPSLSPDGRRALFASRIEEMGLEFRKRHDWSKTSYAGDIWMFDRDTGAFTPVVRRRDNCTSPIWTPDGKGFYYLCDAGGVRNLYRRSLATGEERQITRFSDDHIFCPSLSRDGRTMVFAKGLDLWRIDPEAEKPEARRIALRPAFFDPSAPRTIRRYYSNFHNNYGDGNCTFRADGGEVAFTAGGDVWAMKLADEGRQPVLVHGSSRTHERDCAFSPDGDALYYLSDRGDGTDVWCARRADTNSLWSANMSFVRERLTTNDVCRRALSVSPDGRLLAWHDAQGKLSFAGMDGVVRSVAKVASTACDSYAWSPDGRYVAAALRDGYGNMDVWIVPTWDVDEKGGKAPAPCNISRNHKWDGTPAWSPDGRVVAFSGDRTATGDTSYIFYAYLDPADEAAEANGGEIRKEPCRPDFATLPDRVRSTGIKGYRLLFAPDGRTLSFYYYGDKKLWTIKIPGRMKSEKLLDKDAKLIAWLKDGDNDKLLGSIDNRPSVGDKTFDFDVYKTIDVQDYQELAFLAAWANVRDGFCDANLHGADWPMVRDKYRLAARNAPCWNSFSRIIWMMNGEIDASHLGFYANDATKSRWSNFPWDRGWRIFTNHLGVRFDRSYKGEGWRVRDVVPRSPADMGTAGLLPGDVVMSIDGRKVEPGMDYADVMTGPLPHEYRLQVRRKGKEGLLDRKIKSITFERARRLLRAADVEAARATARGKGNFGYIAIDAMDTESADSFTDQVFAECFGKDGLVIDVRYNYGGRTADRLIDILCGNRHERILWRGSDREGYLLDRYSRPVIADLPVVVLANERSQSNAEEFAHAMQTLKRAKVVGVETSGEVIATIDVNLFDYGVVRRPHIGSFLPDGSDMEGKGAKPDVEVDLTPADIAAGRDPQLAAALDVLAAEVKARPAPPPLRYP
ncbi:MAG: PD40 domain-containing protein [Kiritimatiellae bacterium]|nr:PD40 domain-containing protein [Kiritimatiellia bacterium]